MKEKLGEIQLEKEKEIRAPHNHSYDSALGTDLSDLETETVEVDLDWPKGPLTADEFGFSLAGCKSNPALNNEPGLYVVSVAPRGPADGKLKINDCLLKVGNLSCTSVDCDTVWNLLRTYKVRPVTLTLKRRRSPTPPALYSVKLYLGRGLPHGLILENGLYIRSIAPGSVAARESSLKSGDRLCSINGRPIDSMTSLNEVIFLQPNIIYLI